MRSGCFRFCGIWREIATFYLKDVRSVSVCIQLRLLRSFEKSSLDHAINKHSYHSPCGRHSFNPVYEVGKG